MCLLTVDQGAVGQAAEQLWAFIPIYLGPVLAGSVVQMLPIVVLFILFRKYFLEGMSLSLK